MASGKSLLHKYSRDLDGIHYSISFFIGTRLKDCLRVLVVNSESYFGRKTISRVGFVVILDSISFLNYLKALLQKFSGSIRSWSVRE